MSGNLTQLLELLNSALNVFLVPLWLQNPQFPPKRWYFFTSEPGVKLSLVSVGTSKPHSFKKKQSQLLWSSCHMATSYHSNPHPTPAQPCSIMCRHQGHPSSIRGNLASSSLTHHHYSSVTFSDLDIHVLHIVQNFLTISGLGALTSSYPEIFLSPPSATCSKVIS